MDTALRCPLSKAFPVEPEYHSTGTPKHSQCHVGHERRDVTYLFHPRRYKLRDTIAPQVLIDGHQDEDRSSGRLVRINSVGGSDRRKSGDLYTRACEADNYNSLSKC